MIRKLLKKLGSVKAAIVVTGVSILFSAMERIDLGTNQAGKFFYVADSCQDPFFGLHVELQPSFRS